MANNRSATIMAPKPPSSRLLRSFRLRLALRPQGVDSTAWVIIMMDIKTGSCALSITYMPLGLLVCAVSGIKMGPLLQSCPTKLYI